MNPIFQNHMEQVGFTTLTPIQEATMEKFAAGQSIDALAPTGTGKTLAFTWPLLPNLQPGDGEQVLILAPSQELAMQTTRVMREWAGFLDLKVLALTGGANVKRQLDSLKKHPEIIVGTPGRVSELVNNRKLKLTRLRTLILDEADVLLRDETANQIDLIWDEIDDAQVQVAMFGATEVDPAIPAGLFDRDFERIDVRDVPMPTAITHEFWPTATDQRNKRLRQMASRKNFQAIVFFNTTKGLKTAASFLAHEHVAMATLASGDSSSTRAKALDNFRNGKAQFLLTTDVAARGLDIPNLPAVINFDLPRNGETYTHRAGRTGRMGKKGLVLTFGNDHDFRDLKRLVKVEIATTHGIERDNTERPARQTTGKPAYQAKRTTGSRPATSMPKAKTTSVQAFDASAKVASGPSATVTTRRAPKPVAEVVSRQDRFAKEKKAKRKHNKDKGKPKPKAE
ncbi:MAG: DEAD/DEAH box helicase [Lactobacillaceae bacterium]|nr:DEAD/DEAH box helicase [Lactobacillaceae bacterium]